MSLFATEVSGELAAWWWSALGVGLVVAIVVVVLLQMLLNRVREIEDGASRIWAVGQQVARNTATVWMIGETARIAGEIHAEVGRQARSLEDGG